MPLFISLVRNNYCNVSEYTDQIEISMISQGYNILICNNRWVLDPTSMQFGIRGPNGELVGRLENMDNYFRRFPGKRLEVVEMYLKEEKMMLEGLYQMNKSIIDQTIQKDFARY